MIEIFLRSNILNEILQTEINYVNSLKTIIESYKQPLEQSKLLTQNDLDAIFVNLEEIAAINLKFSNALFKRMDEAKKRNELARVGDIFMEYLPKMHIYTKYVSAKRYDAEDIINEKMKISVEFSNILNRANGNSDSGDFLLKKMLLLPMQRLTQYSLLIDKVSFENFFALVF